MARRSTRRRRQQNRAILFDDNAVPNESESVDSSSDDDTAPYSTDHLLQYCRKNWHEWVSQTQAVLSRYQRELTPHSSRLMVEAVYDIEDFYGRMEKVSSYKGNGLQ